MNIFTLDIDPKKAAEYHCDAHVVKMILETAQILSAVWHKSGLIVPDGMYKCTHKNHPCTVWAGETNSNYGWLVQLGFALCDEYTHRYSKIHKSLAVIALAEEPPNTIKHGDLTPFALAMPEELKSVDSVEAYRAYYATKARTLHRFTYTNRQAPSWLAI